MIKWISPVQYKKSNIIKCISPVQYIKSNIYNKNNIKYKKINLHKKVYHQPISKNL